MNGFGHPLTQSGLAVSCDKLCVCRKAPLFFLPKQVVFGSSQGALNSYGQPAVVVAVRTGLVATS
jgi:hypothetical protein